MASIARSLVLVTIAFCFAQVLAQEYQPKCQTTTAYILDADAQFTNWGRQWIELMVSTNKEFSFLNVGDLNAGFLSSAQEYSFTPTLWNVFSLNMILEDIPTRNIPTGRIVLIVSINIQSQLTDLDVPSAIVAAANRLKEQHNVEIFLVDITTSAGSINEWLYKVAQDVASNPLEGHVVFSEEVDFNLFMQETTGVRSTTCVSLGGLYFYTLDGASYDFNGLGEYLLVGADDYIAQVRLAPCDYSNPTARTCLRAIAVKSADSGDVLEVHYDPVAEYISVYFNGMVRDPSARAAYFTEYGFGEFDVHVVKIQTPVNAEPVFEVFVSTNTDTEYIFFVGQRMGLSMYTVLDQANFGRTTGLCGTWDGCLDNEYYSQNQTFTPVAAAPSDIYYNFAESWRVSEANSLFTHGVNAKYFMPSYGSYSPLWKPAMTGVQPTATASNDCSFFQNIAPFLYTACLDEVSKGNSDIRTIAYYLVAGACSDLCDQGYTSATFVSESYCASTCARQNDLDFHEVYNNTNLPPFTLNPTSIASTFSATLGGTYTYELSSQFCPNSGVTGTVQITCDQPPTVNAGDDMVVKKDETYGWPVILLVGTASDENSPALEISWTLISYPMGANTTAGSWQPYLPVSGAVPLLINQQTMATQVIATYPGDYVFELSVFDGCYLAKDQITVHAVCAGCQLHVEASGIADQTYEWTGTSSGYTPSVSSSAGNTFDYVYSDTAEPHWFIDSNSQGYSFVYPVPGSNDVYDFVITPPETIINRTVIGEVFVTDNQTSTDGPINTATILRYEGVGHWSREITTNTTKITTTITYSSVPIPVTKCSIEISDSDSYDATFQVVYDAYANVSRPFTQQPACVGDYAVRVAVRDECQAAYDVTNFHVGCSEQPQAHLVSCQKSIKYDYSLGRFPTVSLDGRDTYDPDTPSSNLLYQWEVVTPSGVTGYFANDCVGMQVPDTDAYVACSSNSFIAGAGPGTYTINMWVSDGCTYDYESTTIVAQCDPLSATAFAANVAQDLAAPANGIANLTGLFVSQHPSNVGFQWRLVSAPQGYEELPVGPSSGMTSGNTTASVYLGGSYTYELTTSDGCTAPAQNVSFTYTCSSSMSFALSASPQTVDFPAGYSFPSSTITIDMNTTVNTASNRAYFRASLVGMPAGTSVTIPYGAWTLYNGGANPTINIAADLAGTYIVQVWVTDSCNYATHNITVTATCNALVPTINGVGSVYTIPSLGFVTVAGVFISDSFVNYTIYWELVDSFNNTVYSTSGLGITTVAFNVYDSGAYQIRVTAATGLSGCYATNSVPVSITANCNYTLGIDAPTGSYSSTFVRGKFPRVTITPTFSGVDPEFIPMINSLSDYTWTFKGAPSGSVFEPTTTVNSYVSKNTSTITGYVYDAVNDIWTTTQVDTVEWTTIIDTKYVTLDYDATFDAYDGCFSPDVAGTYTLEFSIFDYCGKLLTQTYTVTAGCNTPPTANAGTDATYTFEGTGFSSAGTYMYTAVPLNGSGSDTDNDFLRYQWSVVSQPNNHTDFITINNPYSRLATFVPTVAGVYVVRLSVTDGCTIANSTVTITVVCPNSYQVNAPISFTFDGFTPVAIQEFSLLANPQCTRALTWAVTKYDPSTAIPPVTATGGEIPKSGANHLAIPSILIAFLAMIVKML